MSIERIALVGTDLLGLVGRCASVVQVDRDLKNLADCVRDADLVVEALSEQPEHGPVKEHVLREIDASSRPDALVAMVRGPWLTDDFAELLTHPSRLVSVHVPAPHAGAAACDVVEIAGHRQSDPMRIEALWSFLNAQGFTTLAAADAPGGVVDRLAVPYFNEAVRLVSEGHALDAVEQAARRAFGTDAGPFACMNRWGLPRVQAASGALGQAWGAFYAPPAGLEGRAEPWAFADESERPADATKRSADATERPADEIKRSADATERSADNRSIAERLWGVAMHVALDMISEHITSPRDIDVGACAILGWSRGPFVEMQARGPVETARLATPVQTRYRLWAPAALHTMCHIDTQGAVDASVGRC